MTRTRFAPSPSGYMHIGNLRSALFAYLIARNDGGEFILRLEDTDQERYEMGAEDFIYKVMDVFNLEYDEGPNKAGNYGPYIQSERLDIYKQYAENLVKKKQAYYCFCNESMLNTKRLQAQESNTTYVYDGTCRDIPLEEAIRRVTTGEKYVIRQKVPKEGKSSYCDLVYGDITAENITLEDQILIKSNGYPTYNFANVVDDALMEITHVTRGNEYLASTPKYLLLYDALEFPRPEFVHLPLVVKKDGTKIDKDDSLNDLLEQGFLPDAILNYVALLGWSPKTEQEFFTLDELVREFKIENIKTRQACYDIKKLEWFNSHYIKKMSDDAYLEFIRPYLERFYKLEDKSGEWVNSLLLLYKNYISFGAEIAIVTNMFFNNDIEVEKEAQDFLKSEVLAFQTVNMFKKEVMEISDWTVEEINRAINKVKMQSGVSDKLLYLPIRIVVSGRMEGPELANVIYLLGKDVIINRLDTFNI